MTPISAEINLNTRPGKMVFNADRKSEELSGSADFPLVGQDRGDVRILQHIQAAGRQVFCT